MAGHEVYSCYLPSVSIVYYNSQLYKMKPDFPYPPLWPEPQDEPFDYEPEDEERLSLNNDLATGMLLPTREALTSVVAKHVKKN